MKVVGSFDELVSTKFGSEVNALCWPRRLTGDFREIAENLGVSEDVANLDATLLRSLPLSAEGRAAVDILLEDQERLAALGFSPILNCIHRYPRDEASVVPTDVYSFHADSATIETDTYLCSYSEAASEGLRNDEARRCVDVPEIRGELLKRFGGEDDSAFLEHLKENCYDLHYVPLPQARPFSFGLGNFWRIAVDYPGSPVPPCIHRAPETRPNQRPRIILIS